MLHPLKHIANWIHVQTRPEWVFAYYNSVLYYTLLTAVKITRHECQQVWDMIQICCPVLVPLFFKSLHRLFQIIKFLEFLSLLLQGALVFLFLKILLRIQFVFTALDKKDCLPVMYGLWVVSVCSTIYGSCDCPESGDILDVCSKRWRFYPLWENNFSHLHNLLRRRVTIFLLSSLLQKY